MRYSCFFSISIAGLGAMFAAAFSASPVLAESAVHIEHVEQVRNVRPEAVEGYPVFIHADHTEHSGKDSGEIHHQRHYNHYFDRLRESSAESEPAVSNEENARSVCRSNEDDSLSSKVFEHNFLISGLHNSVETSPDHKSESREKCLDLRKSSQLHQATCQEPASQGAGPAVVNMSDGSLLVLYKKPILLHTALADVEIAPRTQVFVIQLDGQLGVYDLMDNHNGSVRIDLKNGTHQNLSLREGMVLSNYGSTEFSKLSIAKGVRFKSVKALKKQGEKDPEAFKGDFSYDALFSTSPQLHTLIQSDCPNERRVKEELLKTLASMEILNHRGY